MDRYGDDTAVRGARRRDAPAHEGARCGPDSRLAAPCGASGRRADPTRPARTTQLESRPNVGCDRPRRAATCMTQRGSRKQRPQPTIERASGQFAPRPAALCNLVHGARRRCAIGAVPATRTTQRGSRPKPQRPKPATQRGSRWGRAASSRDQSGSVVALSRRAALRTARGGGMRPAAGQPRARRAAAVCDQSYAAATRSAVRSPEGGCGVVRWRSGPKTCLDDSMSRALARARCASRALTQARCMSRALAQARCMSRALAQAGARRGHSRRRPVARRGRSRRPMRVAARCAARCASRALARARLGWWS